MRAAAGCLLLAAGSLAFASESGRQRPLPDLACDRNALTSYTGAVQGYERSASRLRIVVRTDWQTSETVSLPLPAGGDASARLRLRGAPFTAADWSRIEDGERRAQPGLRVTAWVCEDGRTPPLIDWQPAVP